MEIYLVRHGETEWNVERRIQGHCDSSLTEEGIKQAAAVAQRLKYEHFDAVYSSDLGRALATAQYIMQYHENQQLIQDNRLRERNFGILEQLDHETIANRYPAESALLENRDAEFVIINGESKLQMLDRALAFLRELQQQYTDGKILCITHGGLINVILRHTLQISMEAERRFLLPNTGINILVFADEKWMVKTVGDVSHLFL